MRFFTRILGVAYALSCLAPTILASPVGPRDLVPEQRKPKKCHEKRNFNTVSSIYNLTVYPNQLPIIGGGSRFVPPGLFSHEVAGRVDPVGKFLGFEDSIEYFFALAPLPQGNAASAAITSYQIVSFTSGCKNIAASVVYLYCNVVAPGSPDHGKALAPLKQIAFWKFDDEGAVLRYDAWIPNLDDWVNTITGGALHDPEYQQMSIEQVCAVTQLTCQGPNKQWESIGECVAALVQKPYGRYEGAWGDNVVCRTIHLVLTQVRPDVHCAHVGPTGGGKCINIKYPQDYFTDEVVFGDPVGDTFVCK